MIFENESLDYLIRTGEHCIHKDYVDYLKGNKGKIIETKGDKQYKIGIIVPNYNNEKWIEKCLKSIINQTYRNYQIIVIDDCSTDNSIDIATKYADIVIPLKQKRYNGGARNEGYLYLDNDVDYVYYVDSDDWLTNEYSLETINDNLQGSPDVLFVGVGADYNGIMRCFYQPNYKDRYEAILGWSGCYGMVVKKELALRCLFPEGTLKEDRTQHYKVCIEMNSFRCTDKLIYTWNRNNQNSVTTIRGIKWKADTIRNWADAVEMYETYKGKDSRIDQLLMNRIVNCKMEIDRNGDEQR